MNGNTGHASRILIVEDVQETRDSIRELLKSDGYQVDAVPDEDEAQDKIERNPPDLILVIMKIVVPLDLGGKCVPTISLERLIMRVFFDNAAR